MPSAQTRKKKGKEKAAGAKKKKIIKIILKKYEKIIHFGVVGFAAMAIALTSLVGLLLIAPAATPRYRPWRSISTRGD